MLKMALLPILLPILLVWLLIGTAAAYQRDYFEGDDRSCAKTGTIVVTIAAGLLNYLGANPKISCELPQPSN